MGPPRPVLCDRLPSPSAASVQCSRAEPNTLTPHRSRSIHSTHSTPSTLSMNRCRSDSNGGGRTVRSTRRHRCCGTTRKPESHDHALRVLPATALKSRSPIPEFLRVAAAARGMYPGSHGRDLCSRSKREVHGVSSRGQVRR